MRASCRGWSSFRQECVCRWEAAWAGWVDQCCDWRRGAVAQEHRRQRDDGRSNCHVTEFYLCEKQSVLNPGVLSLLGGEKGSEAGQPFLCTGDQIVGREGIR